MIRTTVISTHKIHYQIVQNFIKKDIKECEIQKFDISRQYDIYFIEINKQEDFQKYQNIKRNQDTLIYIIGPEEFSIIQTSLEYHIQYYFRVNHLESELIKQKENICQQIQKHFRFYVYQKGTMQVQIRLSDIYYIESLRHRIIIHSINGELQERKNLKDLMDEIGMFDFIQIHKSFVINKQMISKYDSKVVYLKDSSEVPIGRAYKNILINQHNEDIF